MQKDTALVVHLSSIEELFVAPAANPFSTHAVDILGEAGLDLAQKRVKQHWPRLPRALRLTVQLPADRIAPEMEQQTRVAVRRYCSKKIEDNRLQRQLAVRRSLRQLVGALAGIVLALGFIGLLAAAPLELLPAFLRGVLIVLALYACSVLSFDAVWSLAFDWVPYMQENKVFRVLEAGEITVESAQDLTG
jgi:hypothetical protein